MEAPWGCGLGMWEGATFGFYQVRRLRATESWMGKVGSEEEKILNAKESEGKTCRRYGNIEGKTCRRYSNIEGKTCRRYGNIGNKRGERGGRREGHGGGRSRRDIGVR